MVIKRLNILLIEDDEEDYLIIKSLFSHIRDLQSDIQWVPSYFEALKWINNLDQDICLIDYRLGDGNGLDLLRKARENGCIKPIIILTGQGDLDVDMEAMKAGASDYLVKGELNAQVLERSVRYAINIAQTIDTLRHAHGKLALEIEERKKAEIELIKAQKSAEDASRIKSEFLSNVSHEIRTPMCTIIGMAELLSESGLSTAQKTYVKTSMQAGNDLLHLIDEIINISKIESSQVEIEAVPFELDGLPLKIASVFEKKAQAKGLQFTCHVASDVPIKLIGDPAHLEQILTHFISNAIKFTEQGEVVLNVSLADKNSETKKEINLKYSNRERDRVEECYLQFSIADTGVGIPKQKLHAIFDSFSQADSSSTKVYGGVGLGVTISKKLIEMMGGEVWVKSVEGRGSTFYFNVRLWQQAKNSEAVLTDVDLSGVKLLMIDGSPAYQFFVKDELVQQGATVVLTQSRVDEMPPLMNSEAGYVFDLVIVDHLLPNKDDITFIDKIRTQYRIKKDIPILLLGAYCKYFKATPDVKLGAVSCIKKPVRTADLISEIKNKLNLK
ncbi:MAG: ATP-binding protein [Candidatus Polarisedimenticolaceae bacterium]|nr:ATP-binding protein [Candidatus Polarisedimenticolaceae bacterium]